MEARARLDTISIKKRLFIGVISGFGVLLLLASTKIIAQEGITQTYFTNDPGLVVGMAVSQNISSNPDRPIIERATRGNREQFLGVVTTLTDNTVAISGGSTSVPVLSSGETDTYISDINGPIASGDLLTVSPLAGVLMRADDTEAFIVGAAVEHFNAATATPTPIEGGSGQDRTVLVNVQKVNINPYTRELQSQERRSPFLVLVGESIVGKPVGQLQVTVALVIFLLILVIEGAIVYAAVRNSIVAIGRNPLSRMAVYRQLLQVSWLALSVLVFGIIAIYVILWA